MDAVNKTVFCIGVSVVDIIAIKTKTIVQAPTTQTYFSLKFSHLSVDYRGIIKFIFLCNINQKINIHVPVIFYKLIYVRYL